MLRNNPFAHQKQIRNGKKTDNKTARKFAACGTAALTAFHSGPLYSSISSSADASLDASQPESVDENHKGFFGLSLDSEIVSESHEKSLVSDVGTKSVVENRGGNSSHDGEHVLAAPTSGNAPFETVGNGIYFGDGQQLRTIPGAEVAYNGRMKDGRAFSFASSSISAEAQKQLVALVAAGGKFSRVVVARKDMNGTSVSQCADRYPLNHADHHVMSSVSNDALRGHAYAVVNNDSPLATIQAVSRNVEADMGFCAIALNDPRLEAASLRPQAEALDSRTNLSGVMVDAHGKARALNTNHGRTDLHSEAFTQDNTAARTLQSENLNIASAITRH